MKGLSAQLTLQKSPELPTSLNPPERQRNALQCRQVSARDLSGVTEPHKGHHAEHREETEEIREDGQLALHVQHCFHSQGTGKPLENSKGAHPDD